jgi:large subunit ribosomal protein L5
MARLKQHYEKVVRPRLQEEFKYKNPMQVPRIEKIVINMGIGEATQDSKKVAVAVAELTAIAGHLAPGPHVRVPRPAREHRAAARA